MNRADVFLTRTRLGLPQSVVADLCGVTERTVRRWEAGETQIDGESADLLQDLANTTDRITAEYIARFLEAGGGVFSTFAPGSSAFIERPDLPCLVPATWHQTIATRIHASCPNVQVSFTG